MTYHVFLKFEPTVTGESETQGFAGQIPLTRWHFTVSNGVHYELGKKLQKGTVQFDAINVFKRNDSSTPALMKLVTVGKDGTTCKATITVCVSSEKGVKPSLTMTLENAIVSSVSVLSHGDGVIEDEVAIHFTKVTYEYQIYDNKGQAKTKPDFKYDLDKQAPF